MDADLVAALGTTPTVMEKLYAEAIEDSRAGVVKWDEERQRLAEWRTAATAWMDWMKAQYNELPPELFDDNDRLYTNCIMQGLDLRKQALSTATTKSTEDDVINDGFRIGGEIFRRIQARKALVKAGSLDPTAVPPAVL
jgi:hypothetical protein